MAVSEITEYLLDWPLSNI